MSKQINKTMIGAFILGAVVLVTIGILTLGSGTLFRESTKYVMYFSGSVRGLGLGAPVKLKGVPIGLVTDINLVYKKENHTFISQVIIEIPEGSVKTTGASQHQDLMKQRLTTYTNVDQMIESGLRAKLQLQSFVTGQLLVGFDFYPNTPITLMNFDDDFQEMPTLPSDMDALAKTMDSIDLESIVGSLGSAIQGIDKMVNSADLIGVVSALSETLKSFRKTAMKLDRNISQLTAQATETMADIQQLMGTAKEQILPMTTEATGMMSDLRHMISDLERRLMPALDNTVATTAAARDAFQQADVMFGNLAHLSDEDSALIYRIEETMTEIRKATGALAALADYLNRHPEALLRGRQSAAMEEK